MNKTGLAKLQHLNLPNALDHTAQGQHPWRWLDSGEQNLQQQFPPGRLQLTVDIDESADIDDSAHSLDHLPREILHDGKQYLYVPSSATCCI